MDLRFIENLKNCECGRVHTADIKNIISGKGALLKLPAEIKKLKAEKVFLLADKNTWKAAGEKVKKVLNLLLYTHILCIVFRYRKEPS